MKRKPLIRKPCSLCGLVFRHRRDCSRARAPKPPKARKPIKARNYKRRPAQLAVAQREAVLERSGYRCEFEIRSPHDYRGDDVWFRCEVTGAPRLQCAHVIRRHLCGDAVYDPAVAIAGCDVCHAAFDHRTHPSHWDRVRVPEYALTRAISAIKAAEQSRRERGLAVVNLPPKNEDAA